MELELNRKPSHQGATFGDLYIDGVFECYTLEDEIRERPGVPVAEWKVPGKTAIPAGRYRLTLEASPRFGADTITLNGVPGFAAIRMHGGNTADDTEGCVLVGDHVDIAKQRISGAAFDHVLDMIEVQVKHAIEDLEEVWITIYNPAVVAT